MNDKIEKAIEYYTIKSKEVIEYINSNHQLTARNIK